MLIPTLRDVPADAEVVSHKLLVRAGMIRQVARGIYDFLPLGVRVRAQGRAHRPRGDGPRRRAGGSDARRLSGRAVAGERALGAATARSCLRFKDRNDRDFCFGPTHEEVVTDLVRRDVRSYRDLPLNLYQIQMKFRDEVRPRFGLMRGREFIMKDAYSFHVDARRLRARVRAHVRDVPRIFERCGLAFRPVEADTGAIGGSRCRTSSRCSPTRARTRS